MNSMMIIAHAGGNPEIQDTDHVAARDFSGENRFLLKRCRMLGCTASS